MADITSGIVTSFSNTPQAQSDLYAFSTLTEDAAGTFILNVMANDLGGNAKVLWSLDNADSASTGTKTYAPSDLLVQDTDGACDSTPDTSQWGAKIWITSEGKVAYQMTEASKAHFQSLGAGEIGLDTFTYAIRMSNGALSWSTVTVQILGTNDAPTSSGLITNSDANEAGVNPDGTAQAGVNASGAANALMANISDVDSSSFTIVQAKENTLGSFAGVTAGTDSTTGQSVTGLYGTLTVGADGSYSYVVNQSNGTVQALTESGSLDDVFVVTVSDGAGGTVNQTLKITIDGTNDAPVIDLNTGTGGLNNTATFTEVSGPDTGANAVFFSAGGTNITDVDSATMANLKVSLSAASAATGDRLVFGGTVIDITGTAAMGEVTAGGTVFGYAIADAGGTRTITFTSLSGSGGSATEAPKASYEALLDGLKYNNTSDTPVDGSTRAFSVTVNDGAAASASATVTVTLVAVADDTTSPFAVTPATISKSPTLTDRTVVLSFSEALAAGTFTTADVSVTGGGTISSVTPVAGTNNTQFTIVVAGVGNPGSNTLLTVLAGGYTDVAGNAGLASNSISIKNPGNQSFPAGAAGSPINLALSDPSADTNDLITIVVAGVPAGWTLNAGTNNGDGTWTVQTSAPSSLTVTTPVDFTGAVILGVNMNWTNPDGSTGSVFVNDNVEAYAPGSPIFALSFDDHLTASSAADLLVFAQPIANDVIHSFDAAHDKIDLIGFTGVSGYADLAIADDANGNAVITLANGSTITVLGVHAADLGAANFEFNLEPVTVNTGTITIADGAILPLGGIVENSGTIALGSTGSETNLQVLVESLTLQGGGHVLLSDDANNVIFGGAANATLINVDNTISGAGQIGAGQMTLVNAGTIIADGTQALVIDTGSNAVVNSGTLAATGSGGLIIADALVNAGSLWANGGDITVHGDVSGSGSATISGDATLEFGGASTQDALFDAVGNGTLMLGSSQAYSGTVGGMNAGDVIDFGDVMFGVNATVSYASNATATGGVLSITDGVHAAQIAVQGQYSAAGFQAAGDAATGTAVAYAVPLADQNLAGGAGDDGLVGGAGNDRINGGAGSDVLVGGSGNDTVQGDEADDVIIGGFGADRLAGNAGNDIFRFLDTRDTGDTITDFASGDKIDFSNIDADPSTANDTFAFAGNTSTLAAHAVNWFLNDNGTAAIITDDFTVIQADTDGNVGTAEMEIHLIGTISLVTGDFLL